MSNKRNFFNNCLQIKVRVNQQRVNNLYHISYPLLHSSQKLKNDIVLVSKMFCVHL